MQEGAVEKERVILSTLPAGRGDRRLALAIVLLSTAVFLAAAPFAKSPLPQVQAFMPMYQSALVVNDLITAVLLYGQYNILRSRALLVLASGYLFSAFMAVAHLLSFPGLFAPTGLLGAGGQTTAWLYFIWHGIFPVCVLAYVLLKDERREPTPTPASCRIAASIGCVFAAACAFVFLTTAGHELLPPIMHGNRDAPAKVFVATASWMLSLVALGFLWRRKRSVLDLWLMVVMCVWIFDIALASVLNAGRFDVGWYFGRIYGLLAASFVLMVLLLENSMLYARLVEAHERERRERRRAEEKSAELVAVNRELDAFSYSISHDLRAPLRAVNGFSRMLEEDYGDKLDREGRRLLEVVRESSLRMGQMIDDLLAFSRMGRQPLRTARVELDRLIAQTIAEVRAGCDGRTIEFRVDELGAVDADATLLKHALTNLLSNAAKYSRDRDPAVVQVGRMEAAAGQGLTYFVKDNGAGFDMSRAGKLFGVFQRLHPPEEFEGTGVGLAIVQRVIERHGGKVWAEAAPDRGATFFFTLGPAAKSETGAPA